MEDCQFSSREAMNEAITRLIDMALKEDAAGRDTTSSLLTPPDLSARAVFLAKAEGVLAGIEVAGRVFKTLEAGIAFTVHVGDGSRLKPGDTIAEVAGAARTILAGERTALNFLQRLSGIATHTSQFVEKMAGIPVWIADTRKTTPGFRLLEKYAVRMGGGRNHRMNLEDGILIKDNHLALLRKQGVTLEEAVRKARWQAPPGLKVEVETTTLDEVREAASAGADIIMFDNMDVETMRRAVKMLPAGIWSEASGGVTLETVRAIAETGVTYISVGALTHSSRALDISLELVA